MSNNVRKKAGASVIECLALKTKGANSPSLCINVFVPGVNLAIPWFPCGEQPQSKPLLSHCCAARLEKGRVIAQIQALAVSS